MNPKPRISALVATFNRAASLAQTLPSLLHQDLPAEQYEVIVIDDGSTDNTSQYLKTLSSDPRLKIISGPNLGQGCAYNRGLEIASGDYLLFLDDDIFCPPTLFSAHISAHNSDDKLVISGPLKISPASRQTLATDWVHAGEAALSSGPNAERRWPRDTKLDANSSVPRGAIKNLGGFSPEFSRARFDLEMGLRLSREGFRFLYCDATAAEQLYTKSAYSLLTEDAPAYGRAELALCRKFPEFRHASTFAAATSGGLLRRLAKRLAIANPLWPSRFIAWSLTQLDRFRDFPRIRALNLWLFQSAHTLDIIRAGRKESGSAKDWHREFALSVPALLYHHVGPARVGTFPTLTVSPDVFAKHLRWLRQSGYNCISAAQWSDWYWKGTALPEKPILLTFDDGYKDLAEHAFPLLTGHGAGATVFIVTSQLGGSNLWDQRSGSAPHQLLSPEDIRTWFAKGIDFGSHSRTHPDLTTLDRAQLEAELSRSCRVLSDLVNKEVISFAYPYGANNSSVREAARSIYRCAFSTDVGPNTLAGDAFALTRSMVRPNDSRLDILARARFGWNPIEGARRRIAKARGRI